MHYVLLGNCKQTKFVISQITNNFFNNIFEKRNNTYLRFNEFSNVVIKLYKHISSRKLVI